MSRGWGGVHAHRARGVTTEACPPGRRIEILVDTKLAASGPKPDERARAAPRHGHQGVAPLPLLPPPADRRASGARSAWRCSWRSTSLGLALGLYVALVLRTRALRRHRLLVAALAGGPARVAPVPDPGHRARLPPGRPLRPRASIARASGASSRRSILVALIILSVGLGTGYDFTTTGLIPTAVVTCSLAIGLLRAAYSSFALELMRAAGIRRKVVLVGEARSLEQLHRELGATRGRHRLRVPRRRLAARRSRTCRSSARRSPSSRRSSSSSRPTS